MKTSLILALAFWFLLVLTLALEEIFYLPWARTQGFAISTTILASIIALGWVLAHADENDVKPSRILKVCVVALAPIAVLYYRFRYFGARSGFMLIAWLLAGFAVALAVLTLVDYLVNGATAAGVDFAAGEFETASRTFRGAGVDHC